MKSILSIEKLLLVFVFFLSGCVSSTSISENVKKENSALATKLSTLKQKQALLDGKIFYYPFLGLTMALPETWSLQLDNGRHIPITSDGESVVLNDKASNESAALLHLKGQSNETVFNPVLTLIVADFNRSPSLKRLNNKQVMKFFNSGMRRSLKKSKLSYSFNRETYYTRLGDVEYSVFPADINVAGNTFFQDYYSIYIKGVVLTFVLTYENSSSLQQLEKVIKGAEIAARKSAKAV